MAYLYNFFQNIYSATKKGGLDNIFPCNFYLKVDHSFVFCVFWSAFLQLSPHPINKLIINTPPFSFALHFFPHNSLFLFSFFILRRILEDIYGGSFSFGIRWPAPNFRRPCVIFRRGITFQDTFGCRTGCAVYGRVHGQASDGGRRRFSRSPNSIDPGHSFFASSLLNEISSE